MKKRANKKSDKRSPRSLKNWFLIHFIVDILFAIPLIIAPIWFLELLGFNIVHNMMPIKLLSRLVGAALIGIGGASFFTQKKNIESFDILLTLKILWSLFAIIAIVLSLIAGAPFVMWIILLVFVIFSVTWICYKRKLF